jgi:signal transduction histidine kinase
MEAVLYALEHKRASLAQSIRSEAAQSLTAVLAQLSVAARLTDLNELQDLLTEVRLSLRTEVERLQTLATDVRPSVLDDFGLAAAVQGAATRLSARSALTISIEIGHLQGALTSEEQTLIYRTLEEAMSNAANHSGGRMVSVTSIRDGIELQFMVTDDGHGFDVDAAYREPRDRTGLLLMEAQARALGGTLEISASSGAGTTVALRVPLDRPAND